jgi:hypothetical protein
VIEAPTKFAQTFDMIYLTGKKKRATSRNVEAICDIYNVMEW